MNEFFWSGRAGQMSDVPAKVSKDLNQAKDSFSVTIFQISNHCGAWGDMARLCHLANQ